jgi:SAM-dependent methyltransferase
MLILHPFERRVVIQLLNEQLSAAGDAAADIYDELIGSTLGDPGPAAAFLADLASGGRALELGIGTGRLALPLAALGVEVWGIDASTKMVERLRAKPGGAALPVVIGDFADVDVSGNFRVVFVAFNTFYALRNQEEQVRCFQNVAQHLEPGGAFVIEAMVIDVSLYDLGQRVHVYDVEPDNVWLEASRYNPRTQQVHSQQIVVRESGVRFYPTEMRIAPPTELDLMSRLAGLRLEQRRGGWESEPFTAHPGSSHVSVYRKPAL